MRREIIIHMLTWRIRDIINELPNITTQGFTAIQISPIQPTKDNGYEWWKLYQPLDFTIGNSQIGTKADLIELCTKANLLGIKIIVDVVLRHTAGKDTGELYPHNNVNPIILNNKSFWGEFRNISDHNNRWENNNLCEGVPVLNYNNEDLQNIYLSFLNDLVDCGVAGFRIDMGKHFSLPCEGGTFWTRVIKPFVDKGLYIYSECIDLNDYFLKEYMNYTNVITNYYESIDESKEVRYIESHDTNLSFHDTESMSDDDLVNGWEELSKGGNYSVLFFCRLWSNLWKDSRIKDINLTYRNNGFDNKCA